MRDGRMRDGGYLMVWRERSMNAAVSDAEPADKEHTRTQEESLNVIGARDVNGERNKDDEGGSMD